MNGKIYFNEMDQMVEFLQKYCGTNTATFTARPTNQGEPGEWVLEFNGGH